MRGKVLNESWAAAAPTLLRCNVAEVTILLVRVAYPPLTPLGRAFAVIFATQFQSIVRLFLSAVLLLPDGGITEIRHSHAGGDRPHDHQRIANYDHPIDHGSDDARCCGSHDLAGRCLVNAGGVPHVHVAWFGFHFTYPSPSDSENANHDAQDSLIAQLLNISASPEPAPVVAVEFVQVVDHDAGRYQEITEPARMRCSNMPAFTFLCDTARHERSGVQRI
jgi:hypothetical protein